MAFCGHCGTEVPDNIRFCSKCGQPMNAAITADAATVAGGSGMAENVAGLLCYVLGWVTGLIFFFIDKRPFVRFHAAQSIVVFGGLQVISLLLRWIFVADLGMGGFGLLSLAGLVIGVVNLLALVLWILLMIKAYQHEKFRVPIAANIADGFLAK